MKILKLLIIPVLLFVLSRQNIEAQELKIVHGPYLQNLTTNEVTIVWTTNKDCISWVEYYEEDGSNFYQKERVKIFDSKDGIRQIDTIHQVTVNNLSSSTRYAYRIYSTEALENGHWGETVANRVFLKEPYHFKTQKTGFGEVNCTILADMHENGAKVGALLDGVKWDKTDFVVFNGDLVNTFDNEADLFGGILDTCVSIFAKEKPFYFVRGNHETRGAKAAMLKNYFHFTNNKYYYTFTYGSTVFIVLDAGEDKPDTDIEYNGLADFDNYRSRQAVWLDNLVNSEEIKNAKHIIVFMHIPPFLKDKGKMWHGNEDVKTKFVPLLNKANIDLMLCGHTHAYDFLPKNEEHNFPILISDNNTRIDLKIAGNSIKVIRVGRDSQVISEMTINR